MRQLKGPEKAAAILLSLPMPHAKRLMRHLSEIELRTVAHSVAHLGVVPRETLLHLADEFASGTAFGADLKGDLEEVEGLLDGIVSEEQLDEIVTGINAISRSTLWPALSKVNVAAIAQYLQSEHPQVCAYIIAKLTPATAAGVLGRLPADMRDDILRRVLGMSQIGAKPLEMLEVHLCRDVLPKISARGAGTNEHLNRLAAILNRMDKPVMDGVLSHLDGIMPKETRVMRSLMFTFEDIGRLGTPGISKIVDQVAPEKLVLALSGCEEPLRSRLLGCLSGRARRMIEAELESNREAPRKEITKARRNIADMAFALIEQGVIEPPSEDGGSSFEDGNIIHR